MEALERIKKVHLLYNKEPLTDDGALKVFKELPSDFNTLVLNSEWDSFEAKLKKHYVYLGLTPEEILSADRQIIGKIVKENMTNNKETYNQLGKTLGITSSLLYEFVERGASLNLVHLQKILHHYGLAIAVVTRDLVTDQYYIIQEGNQPSPEELEGPKVPTKNAEGCVDCEEEDLQEPGVEIPPVTEEPDKEEGSGNKEDTPPVDSEGETTDQSGEPQGN